MKRLPLPRRGIVSPAQLRRVIHVAVACVIVAAVVALASWWWSLGSGEDPIDASPVSATATVVSSPTCADGDRTMVRVSGVDPDVASVLDGCGFAEGQRLTVEYLEGHPESVRLLGATPAGSTPVARKALPVVMLLSGLAAMVMLAVVATRYRGRRRTGTVSVAELQRRISQARAAADQAERAESDPGGTVGDAR